MDSEVQSFLEKHGLRQYEESLVLQGVHTIDDLSYLREGDFIDAGMTVVERRKLQQALARRMDSDTKSFLLDNELDEFEAKFVSLGVRSVRDLSFLQNEDLTTLGLDEDRIARLRQGLADRTALQKFLQENSLSEFERQLTHLGITSLTELSKAKESDLQDMGMLLVHLRKIEKGLANLQRTSSGNRLRSSLLRLSRQRSSVENNDNTPDATEKDPENPKAKKSKKKKPPRKSFSAFFAPDMDQVMDQRRR